MNGFVLQPAADAGAADEQIDLDSTLHELDRHLHAVGADLRPPADESAIAAAEQSLRCTFPSKLREIYLWHDGGTGLLPNYDWLSLEELVREYHDIQRLYRELDFPPELVMPVTHLPVFRFDSTQHVSVDCRRDHGGALFFHFVEDPGPRPEYRGLGHFLAVIVDAYRGRIVRRQDHYFDIDEPAMYEVRRRHASRPERERMESNWRGVESGLKSAVVFDFELAVGMLEHVPDRRAAPILLARLKDVHPEVVSRAAFALGSLRAQEALPALTDLLQHPDERVRNLAGAAISSMQTIPAETVAELIEQLGDPVDLVVISAVEALSRAQAPEAVAPLVALLPSVRPGIQQHVIGALGELGDQRAVPALRRLQAELKTKDMTLPDWGGIRGTDPSPFRLKVMVDLALEKLGEP